MLAYTGVMAPVKACLATLLVFAAIYHFLQSSKESNLDYMLQTADWKLRVTSILSFTMQKQLSAMDKVSRKVHACTCVHVYMCTVANFPEVHSGTDNMRA